MKMKTLAALIGLLPMTFSFGADGPADRGRTACFSKAGLVEGTNPATIRINAPNGAGVDFSIDGVAFHKADADNIAMNALAVQAADTTCLYLVQLDSAGALTLKKGEEVSNTDLDNDKVVVHYPQPDDARCPIGAVKIKTVAVTFTSGTTDLSAAGITASYTDFAGGMPTAPVTS